MTLWLIHTLTISLSLSIFMASTPLALGLWIFALALTVSAMISYITYSWLGFLVFLIYIGGLLVMFAYFAAIQPNQHLEMAKLSSTLLLSSTIISISMPSPMLTPSLISSHKDSIPSLQILYLKENIPILLTLGLILLLALIAVVKISQNNQGPLRPFL
uniref:NADH dehydrogenase subunit 6 n=1 Tax=Synelmis amoureuxi TaxID=3053537 RepID=UPI0030E484A5